MFTDSVKYTEILPDTNNRIHKIFPSSRRKNKNPHVIIHNGKMMIIRALIFLFHVPVFKSKVFMYISSKNGTIETKNTTISMSVRKGKTMYNE